MNRSITLDFETLKGCTCGKRAKVVETRPHAMGWYRRYACACGLRWSTMEVMAEDVRIPGTSQHGLKLRDYVRRGSAR